MGKLDGKVAIVTGGTSGIGEGCVRLFAKEGAIVVFSGRNDEQGRLIENRITNSGGLCKYVSSDITSEDNIKSLIKTTIDTYNNIDILMNNAGMFQTGSLEDIETEAWENMFNVNVTGYFLMVKYAMPYLRKSHGVIINNSSIAGMQSYASGRSYIYSSTKAAVIQFSRILALNYAKEVRVNCICPGIIDTPILKGRNLSFYEEKIPMGRVGTPEDVAKVALFLASDDSGYLTGTVIPVDGGVSI